MTSPNTAPAQGTTAPSDAPASAPPPAAPSAAAPTPREIGGPKGPEPTRFGDWERNGRCSDF
ncbi:MAG: DUF1674 domain-containing protein [Alphaproteobacteria bacterium]|nr:DUF1674 domain-containing protein [Alphaproteobacteria bacterium]TAD87066.1 MAG: DUF1674 domain-containing protein [Alphaproteobacteria bacterium]